jgi:hypothetical protein
MLKHILIIALLLPALSFGIDANLQQTIDQAMTGLSSISTSADPYSRSIQRIYIGFDENGEPKTGVAFREIESFKTITGVVVVDKTDTGYMLRESSFPDIGKIKNAKDRKQILTVLEQFQNIPFDPHAEKSAVDSLSGATRYGIKTSGYLNYMARHVALQLANPPAWAQKN